MNVIWLQEYSNATIMLSYQSGRGAARLARLHGVQEVGGSNPLAPTNPKNTVMKAVFFMSTTKSEWLLTSVALRDANTDFILSRQAMNCTAFTLAFYKYTTGKFLNGSSNAALSLLMK